MSRFCAFSVGLVLVATLTACGGSTANDAAARGTAITVDTTKVPARALVDDLRVIAANDRLARVLKKEDDTTLVPKPDTIDPLLAQSWVRRWVDQILADREFRRRGLHVGAANRARAKKSLEQTFRGASVFAAFPQAFRKRTIEREARQDALRASFPATHEPTEAQLQELFVPVEQTCRNDKLIAQIYVGTKAEADQIESELAQGADFATLARERSTDSSAPQGGVAMCIGSPRYQSTEAVVQQAVEQTPIGGTSAPVKTADGYAILRILPLTYDNAHDLLASDWHQKHPSAFYDFIAGQLARAHVSVAKRFGIVLPAGDTVVINPPTAPVKL